MLKMTLFDSVIGKKCCSVDEGQGIALFFCPQPGGFDSSRDPTAGNLPLKAKKKMLKVKVLKLCLNFVKTKTTTPGNNIDNLLITFTVFSSFISFKFHFPYQLFISHTNSHNTLGLPVVALLFNILLSWAFGACFNGFHCLVMCKPWWFKCYLSVIFADLLGFIAGYC